MTSKFQEFDGDELQPIPQDQRQTLTRRSTDNNLDIIAHKTTRIVKELDEFKTEMRDAIKRIEASMTYTHATLSEATERAKKAAETAEQSVKNAVHEAMVTAFPEGDPDGHRRHHELVIKKAEESAEFWATMKKELGKYGLIGFIGWAAYALWTAFLLGPKK